MSYATYSHFILRRQHTPLTSYLSQPLILPAPQRQLNAMLDSLEALPWQPGTVERPNHRLQLTGNAYDMMLLLV